MKIIQNAKKWLQPGRLLGLVAALGFFGATERAQAILTLDWNTVNWTSGSFSQSFDVDGKAGNDITITITGTDFTSGNPDDNSNLPGGTGGQTLFLETDHPDRTGKVVVTITFLNGALGADHVNFSIVDIDADTSGTSDTGYQDMVTNLYGIYNNKLVAPTSVTGSPSNTVSGSGTNRSVKGINTVNDGTSNGNATIDFGLTTVTQISFTWSNGSVAPKNPGNQHIAIGNISFSKVPEVHPGLAAGLFCGLSMGARSLFRRRRGK